MSIPTKEYQINELIDDYKRFLNKKIAALEQEYEKRLRKELTALGNKFDFFRSFIQTLSDDDIVNKPTNEVYKLYKSYCFRNKKLPLSQIEFSKCVTKWFNFSIVNKKVAGIKYRVFVPKKWLTPNST